MESNGGSYLTTLQPDIMTDELLECYRILELDSTASIDDVKQSWRELAKLYHPDRLQHDAKLQLRGQEKLKKINAAYEKLRQHHASKAHEKPAPSNTQTTGQASEPIEEADPIPDDKAATQHTSNPDSFTGYCFVLMICAGIGLYLYYGISQVGNTNADFSFSKLFLSHWGVFPFLIAEWFILSLSYNIFYRDTTKTHDWGLIWGMWNILLGAAVLVFFIWNSGISSTFRFLLSHWYLWLLDFGIFIAGCSIFNSLTGKRKTFAVVVSIIFFALVIYVALAYENHNRNSKPLPHQEQSEAGLPKETSQLSTINADAPNSSLSLENKAKRSLEEIMGLPSKDSRITGVHITALDKNVFKGKAIVEIIRINSPDPATVNVIFL